MKLGISVVTTWTATLDQDIDNYSAAGADGIGVWEYKLTGRPDKEFAARLRDVGLKAGVCGPAVPSILPDFFFSEPRDPKDRTAALSQAIARFAQFDPAAVLCVTGDPRVLGQAEARKVVISGLREAARVAADHGVVLGVEPQRASQNPLVTSLGDAVALVDDIGATNVGILADIYHFWDLAGIEDDLAACAPRLVGVQLSDFRNPTRGPMDRVLPGDGVIDTRAIFRVLDRAGFQEWYDIEVFSDNGLFGDAYPDSLWDEDPREVAMRAVQQVRDLWDTRSQTDAVK
jgi:sugar phosphate isomerase/epimerase